jgi:hypothetical protein
MNKRILLAAAFSIIGSAALAEAVIDNMVGQLQDQGASYIEVQRSNSQVKFEAIFGDRKVEIVVDRATGQVLSQETENASLAEQRNQGVSVRDRGNRTFTGGRSNSSSASVDDSEDDGGRGRGRGRGGDDSEDDHEDGHESHGNDDGPGHDANDDHGGHGGDDGPGHDAGDDHGGDDHGGRGRGGRDD